MRAAMHAFPNAKYFWYVDQNSMILRSDIDLMSYILKPSSLGPIMLKEQPVLLPYGAIKTYKNVKPEDVSFIITQTTESLNSDSFILRNDVYGRGLLEFWSDPLFRKYPTFVNNVEAALTHLLQWHPVLLSKTSIVPARTICSTHDANGLVLPGQEAYRYHDGDFVVDFKNCGKDFHCESLVDTFYKKMEAAK
ncbi:unnamed protein product [Ambrosiozyma monospora]|uniref:Unnamed protein product n=1 Tax=Ambrosiozyma monospora TaxID=43982 RepID=A0ACB5UBM1_AMBMO|nr:unnamed protein product [Ambrosiozyma monospora]